MHKNYQDKLAMGMPIKLCKSVYMKALIGLTDQKRSICCVSACLLTGNLKKWTFRIVFDRFLSVNYKNFVID